jgi:hypothetical protein
MSAIRPSPPRGAAAVGKTRLSGSAFRSVRSVALSVVPETKSEAAARDLALVDYVLLLFGI